MPDSSLRHRVLIGTGGIGAGRFFQLEGNHTLGREESRVGRFLAQRDFCKLHIISHYVKVLLGDAFSAILVSRIGQDDVGKQIYQVMQETGLDVSYVLVCPDDQTMFSLCFLYPDGTGGNLSTDSSACSKVIPEDISRVEELFDRFNGAGVALAAPEVPLEARRRLLELGSQYQFFRVASFISGEIRHAIQLGLVTMIDLLAINLHEAASCLDIPADLNPEDPMVTIQPAMDQFHRLNPNLRVCITAGRFGSWIADQGQLSHLPALPVPVSNTAGAGDAFLGGMIAGFSAGLTSTEAHELARLVAASSVTSTDTINFHTDRSNLSRLVRDLDVEVSRPINRLLGH